MSRYGVRQNVLQLLRFFCYDDEHSVNPKEVDRKKMREVTDELIPEVKKLIIERLKLEGITVDDIDSDAPLFGEGLGLDSIDALELVIGLEKEYGVSIPDAEVGKKVFQSVRAIAQYIIDHQGQVVAAADGAP